MTTAPKSFVLASLILHMSAASTCPPQWKPAPNSFSMTKYGEDRAKCTAACNAAGFCCNRDSGGCQSLPCTTGCHIAWFAQDLADCKAQCEVGNNAGCHFTPQRYADIADAGLSDSWQHGHALSTCRSNTACGCKADQAPPWGQGNDCSKSACAKGCVLAHDLYADLFFRGSDVTIDVQIGLNSSELSAATSRLSKHVKGTDVLSASAITETVSKFSQHAELLETEKPLMEVALDLVDAYEYHIGPLFMNDKTRGGFKRAVDASDGKEMERGMLIVQQAILDNIYAHSKVISACTSFLNGRAWKTATFFPGYAAPPDDSSAIHSIEISARHRKFWGRRVAFAEEPMRKPLGLYLSPGSVATVTVPASIVDKGYQVLVGAHAVDNKKKTEHRRMDRITVSFNIDSTVTSVASPLGGGMYIIVPYLADDGAITVRVTGGVVKAPIFSLTDVHTTTATEWETLRTSPAPWADFETDKFLMQVPRVWMYKLDFAHMETLMHGYDRAMDGMTELGGYYGDFHKDKHVLYLQPDLHIKHGANGIGYPQVNQLCSSSDNGLRLSGFGSEGRSKHWMVNDPVGSSTTYHEAGHAQFQSMYRGELEASNNFFHAYIRNVKENVPFDTAFAESRGHVHMTPDQAAIDWMITPNFRAGREMDHTNTPRDEFRYQHRGYAKYADLARLFGWDAVKSFYHQENLDYIAGVTSPGSDLDKVDSRTLRLSIAAGVDLTPLIHFWGIHPVNPDSLQQQIQEHSLQPSHAVCNLLARYGTLIPRTNNAFNVHYEEVWPGRPTSRCLSPLYGCGWYNVWRDVWNETHAKAAASVVDALISIYYKEGCQQESTTTGQVSTTTQLQMTSAPPTSVTKTTTAAVTTTKKRQGGQKCEKAKNPQKCKDRQDRKRRNKCKKAKNPKKCNDRLNRNGRKLQAARMTTTTISATPDLLVMV